MDWILLGLLSALLAAGGTILEKRALLVEHAMEASSAIALTSAVITLPLFFFADYAALTWQVLGILFGISLFGGIAYLLVAKGMRHMEVSEASPLFAFGPVFTTLLAAWVLREHLDMATGAGIVLLVLGAYVLEMKPHQRAWEPFLAFVRSRAIHFILGGLVIYAFTGVADRFLLGYADLSPLTYMPFVHLFLAFHFLWMMSVFHDGVRGTFIGIRKLGFGWMALMGLVTVGHRFAQVGAVALAFVGPVVALKRLSILFATIFGGELFHEKNLKRKIVAAVVMIAGALLVVI